MRWLGYVGLLLLVLRVVAGCGPSAAAKAQAADTAYAAEHMRCVAQHETNAEIDDCRARVRERWGITMTVTKDGGK